MSSLPDNTSGTEKSSLHKTDPVTLAVKAMNANIDNIQICLVKCGILTVMLRAKGKSGHTI